MYENILKKYNLRIFLEPECPSGHIACPESDVPFTGMNSNRHCIQACNRCDGREDCADGADEEGCCSRDQFTCTKDVEVNATHFLEQECISNSKRCDGNDDCEDKSDETFCPSGNLYYEYMKFESVGKVSVVNLHYLLL